MPRYKVPPPETVRAAEVARLIRTLPPAVALAAVRDGLRTHARDKALSYTKSSAVGRVCDQITGQLTWFGEGL